MGCDRAQPPTQSFRQALQTLIELWGKIYKGTNFIIIDSMRGHLRQYPVSNSVVKNMYAITFYKILS